MGDSNSTPVSGWAYILSLLTMLCSSIRRLVLRIIAVGPIPKHIAIIMDGNRRFADRSGMERSKGHLFGYDRLINTLENCMDLGVKYVSVFAFSIDNFGRPRDEVDSLMRLIEEKLDHMVGQDSLINEYKVRVQVVGDLSLLPASVRVAAERAMAATKEYKSFVLNLCISYTSTAEIVHSIQQVYESMLRTAPEKTAWDPVPVNGQHKESNCGRRRVTNGFKHDHEVPQNGTIPLESMNGDSHLHGNSSDLEIWGKRNADLNGLATCACAGDLASPKRGSGESTAVESKLGPGGLAKLITEEDIESNLYTAGCPPPDIVIRTSGETRLSNFMLWQCCSNSRLSFCRVLWPNFGLRHLAWIILDYQRAFGSLQEQHRRQEQTPNGPDL